MQSLNETRHIVVLITQLAIILGKDWETAKGTLGLLLKQPP